uniref:Cleavage and polyadenylation specificity factor subunit 4 n=1 Tax=Panagrellus redivivus TaxID=6233 RepID=A0A7E4VF60_PANRE
MVDYEIDPNENVVDSAVVLQPIDPADDVDHADYKKDSTDIILWTLSRALNKKMVPGQEDAKYDDEEDAQQVLADAKKSTDLTAAGYSMEGLLGAVTAPVTNIEHAIESQIGLPLMPFENMDRSGRSVCTLFLRNMCPYGRKCHLRHLRGEKTVVCKHWLRGLCKKGDDCEFLHEYDLSKMPECFFFSKYKACSNKECPFRHIDPESKIKDCPWYDRGFCRHGPYCKYRHRRRILCDAYLVGFCPEGPNCAQFHPPNTIPPPEAPAAAPGSRFTATLMCHNCHERGHKANACPHLPTRKPQMNAISKPMAPYEPRRSLADIVCFKCGQKGHYANRCTISNMSFLSGGQENMAEN